MLTAFFGGLVLAYGGMSSLCLGLDRHYRQLRGQPASPRRLRVLRGIGWAALVMSFCSCVAAWGWAMGPVGWLGMCSLAGLALVLLLPYAPRLSLWLPVGGLPLIGLSHWLI